MTDRRPAGPVSPGLRRWPTSPAHFTDTTLCPSCFERLASARCGVCGLDLSTPDAARILVAGERVRAAELERQSLLTSVATAQEAERVAVALAGDRAVAASAGVARAATTRVPETRPATVPAAVPVPAAASVPTPAAETAAVPTASAPSASAPASAAAASGGRRRSGVQVFLLTLGVVLLSITAIVFLFYAFVFASIEVRSIIIAAASVLVLVVAAFLRARRLPGTAEGVAAVAVVLLLLDTWIVRDRGLFGTDALDPAGYTGGALLVVSGILAVTRVVTGIRVPGIAAAGLVPIAAFLLGVQAAPESEPATGAWIGALAMMLVGAAGVAVPTRVERAILLAGGFAGGAVGLIVAVWALPEVAWSQLWTFGLVAIAWGVVLAALRFRAAAVSGIWADWAATGLGLAAAIAPAAAIASELGPGPASWLAPAASGLVVCLFALVRRLRGSGARARLVGLIAAAAVAGAAALPGLVVGAAAVSATTFGGTLPTGRFRDGWEFRLDAETEFGAVLVPLVIAAGSAAVLALLGRLRALAAVPIAAVLTALIVLGGVVDPTWASAATWLATAVGALVWAAAGRRVPGLTIVLAVAGITAAGLGWWLGLGDPDTWPWSGPVVIAAAIAGRLLAARIWPTAAVPVGLAHVVVAGALSVATLATTARWLRDVGVQVEQPATAAWIIVGVGSSILLGLATLVPIGTSGDRVAFAIPMTASAIVAVTALAFATADASWRWVPAAMLALAAAAGLRRSNPAVLRIVLAAIAPLALGTAAALITADLVGADAVGYALAATTLATAAAAHVLARPRADTAAVGWIVAVAALGAATLAIAPTAGEPWLVLAILAPVPIVLTAVAGEPVAGDAPVRHAGWLTPVLVIGSAWSWLLGDGVESVEAYTLPLAGVVAGCGALVAWRRPATAATEPGRTALFGSAAAIAVLPSVASAGDSALRTLVLVGAGAVVAIAGGFLPASWGGVPARLLVVATGWTAMTGAAVIRGLALARGVEGADPIELWPVVALVAGAAVAAVWARSASRPAWVAETAIAASLALTALPTLLAITSDEAPIARAAVLFPAIALAHVAGTAVGARPFAGPIFAWTTRGILVVGGAIALAAGDVEPFDLVTVPVGAAFVAAGAIAMRRSPALGSWAALGAGLAVLLVPPLIADFADPVLWRIVALGAVSLAVLVVGVVRRLQAPVLLGGGVLLVHAIVQLWPYLAMLYEAVWWWLWLGIAGVLLVVLAATYERQLRLARSTIGSIAALR